VYIYIYNEQRLPAIATSITTDVFDLLQNSNL